MIELLLLLIFLRSITKKRFYGPCFQASARRTQGRAGKRCSWGGLSCQEWTRMREFGGANASCKTQACASGFHWDVKIGVEIELAVATSGAVMRVIGWIELRTQDE